jgi:hypothetical protein
MADEHKNVVRIVLRPQFEAMPDGSVRGYYPGENWSVRADSREAALAKLMEEYEEHAATRESVEGLLALVEQSRNGQIEGVEVEEISEDGYRDRMREIGDQIQESEHD